MELTRRPTARRAALAEDVGPGDRHDRRRSFGENAQCRAELLLKEPGVVCGLDAAREVFAALGVFPRARSCPKDAIVRARAARDASRARRAACSTGERTALNLLGRLCGIATLTAATSRRRGHGRRDPRHAQDDARPARAREVRGRLRRRHEPPRRARRRDPRQGEPPAPRRRHRAAVAARPRERNGLPIEVEAETLSEVHEALDAGADPILLDNMPLDELRAAVELDRRPRDARGVRRRHARHRPRLSPRPASTSSLSAR